jgi:hypothetical protein
MINLMGGAGRKSFKSLIKAEIGPLKEPYI